MFRSFPENGNIKYDINHITGIIFGIKLATEDKIYVIDTISKILNQQERSFNFYQAVYENGKIELIKM